MLTRLGLPPLLIFVILLAILAFLVYHMRSVGSAQPLSAIALLLAGVALVRVSLQLLRRFRGQR